MASARCGVRARVVFDGHASKSDKMGRDVIVSLQTKRPRCRCDRLANYEG